MRKGWLGAAAEVRREEWPFAASMASTFFLIITSFWILKPLKKGLFIEFYDDGGFMALGFALDAAQAELLAKVANMVVAAVAALVFGLLARRLRRERLALVFVGFFLGGYALFALLLSDPAAATVWSFYLYGDLFSTLMVASFFAFSNDSVSRDAAKRLYGLVGLGGVLGGAVGSIFLASWIDELDAPQWMGVCAALAVAIAASALAAARFAARLPDESRPRAESEPEEPETGTALDVALTGARLALRSRYLLSIIAIVGLYEVVSTLMDFQFTSAVEHFLDGDAIGSHFSRVYAVTNSAALLVQIFVTSAVMTRLGVGTALLVLPVMAMGGSAVFAFVPTLWTGSALNTIDGAFAYSLNQSAKESLYVPTTTEEKYQAKAFIDMWVQRFAKAIAVLLGLGATIVFQDFATVRWLSAFTLLLLLAWIPAARHAGRRFESFEESPAGEEPPPEPARRTALGRA